MDESLSTFLQRVHSGELAFSPEDGSAAAKERFQPLAKAAVHAERTGLVEGLFTHREWSTGRALYDSVRIDGGLTYRGIREVSVAVGS